MSKTIIRLPHDLKDRVARVAERNGTTPHGFILAAVAEKAEQEERRGEFEALAEHPRADHVPHRCPRNRRGFRAYFGAFAAA